MITRAQHWTTTRPHELFTARVVTQSILGASKHVSHTWFWYEFAHPVWICPRIRYRGIHPCTCCMSSVCAGWCSGVELICRKDDRESFCRSKYVTLPVSTISISLKALAPTVQCTVDAKGRGVTFQDSKRKSKGGNLPTLKDSLLRGHSDDVLCIARHSVYRIGLV